ncbi:MAG: tetratricopeptide repeat protein [Terriglobia bacterium]
MPISILVCLLLWLGNPAGWPQSPQSEFARAEAALREGRVAEAELLYSKVDKGNPNYLQSRLRLGTIYYSTARPAEAEKCFEEVVASKPTAETLCLLSGAQINLEKFEAAYETAKEAIKLDPKYPKAYTAMGMIFTARKDWPEADAAYRESLRLDDKDASTWFLLGRSYFLRNEFNQAREAFEASLKLNPQSIRGYENLGLTLDLLGDHDGAEKAFREGVRLSHNSPLPDVRVQVAYGVFLFKLNRLEESRAQLSEAVRSDPRNVDAHYELARVLLRLKQEKAAASEAEAALRVGGPDYRVHFLLSRIYTALGDSQKASAHASEAARLGEGKQEPR